MNEDYWKGDELILVKKYLPYRKDNKGRPPSIGTIGLESKFVWPDPTMEFLPNRVKRALMGLAMETAVVFIFRNFCYTFEGEKFVQLSWRAYRGKDYHGSG